MREIATGRHAAPRRRRTLALLALGVAVAVLLCLVGTRGTLALWKADAAIRAGTIKSGTASLDVSILPAMYLTALGPGGSTTGAFTVQNTGSVPMDIRVSTTSTHVAYAGSTPDATVLGSLTMHLSSVAKASDCKAGLSGASGPIATFDTGTGYYRLPVTTTRATACLEVSLAADAPQSVSGAVVDFVVTVSGKQVVS